MSKRRGLTGEQRERLTTALVSAFPTRERLDPLLEFGMELLSDDYPGAVKTAIRKLVTDVNADDQVGRLLKKAVERTTNIAVRDFYDDYFSLVSAERRGIAFESMVTGLGFQSLKDWVARAAAVEAQVCRVELAAGTGTGFLVGPDLVLTNYHVVESVVGRDRPGIQLIFDALAPDRKGSPRELASSWLVHSSRYSDLDLDDAATSEPPATELDYALLRTKTAVGEEQTSSGKTRGWQTVSKDAPGCTPGEPLVIVQHPQGEHLQVAIDTNAVLSAGSTRLRYRTNTQHGSSGAPCFDLMWNLVALHHSGDQSFKAVWNEGIPIGVIAHSLEGIAGF